MAEMKRADPKLGYATLARRMAPSIEGADNDRIVETLRKEFRKLWLAGKLDDPRLSQIANVRAVAEQAEEYSERRIRELREDLAKEEQKALDMGLAVEVPQFTEDLERLRQGYQELSQFDLSSPEYAVGKIQSKGVTKPAEIEAAFTKAIREFDRIKLGLAQLNKVAELRDGLRQFGVEPRVLPKDRE
jgi:hypothetical protein